MSDSGSESGPEPEPEESGRRYAGRRQTDSRSTGSSSVYGRSVAERRRGVGIGNATGPRSAYSSAYDRAGTLRTRDDGRYVPHGRGTTAQYDCRNRSVGNSSYPLERYPVPTSQDPSSSYRSTTYQNISASGSATQEIGDRYITKYNDIDNRTINNEITNNNSLTMASGLAVFTIVVVAYWFGGKQCYGDISPSFPMFTRRRDANRFFVQGRVFDMIWSTPQGVKLLFRPQYQNGVPGKDGNYVQVEYRRFIVIKAGENFSTCVLIVSYGPSGATVPGLKANDHGIVFTGSHPPEAEQGLKGSMGIRPARIQIRMNDGECRLQDFARIDYGVVYTVRHDTRVRAVGEVHDSSLEYLNLTFQQVQEISVQQALSRDWIDDVRSFVGLKRQDEEIGEKGSAIMAAMVKCGFTEVQATKLIRASIRRLAERGCESEQAITELQEGIKIPTDLAESDNSKVDGKSARNSEPKARQSSSPQAQGQPEVTDRQKDLLSALIKQGYTLEQAMRQCSAVESLQNRGYTRSQALSKLHQAARSASRRRALCEECEDDEAESDDDTNE